MMTMCYGTFRPRVGRSRSTSEKPTGGASGAVVGALAPNIEVYVLGEILRGLAAGALATATMGVMVTGLPDAWRRLCLAGGSGMWVVAALVGPVYASGVSASWGWRWALVAYLPLLIAARAVMAGRIRDLSLGEGAEGDEAAPWLPAGAMARAGSHGTASSCPVSSSRLRSRI